MTLRRHARTRSVDTVERSASDAKSGLAPAERRWVGRGGSHIPCPPPPSTITTDGTPAAESGQALSNEQVREATFGGVRWFAMTQGLAQVASIASAVILARLIAPSEFGRLAVAIIVSEFALMFATETIGTPLVQRSSVERGHLEAAAFIGILLGLGMALLTLFAVPLLTTPLFGARTSVLFRLFAPMFAITGVFIVPLARLQRDLRFRRIGLSEVVGVLVSAVVAVALAIAGLGAKAYVLGALAGFGVTGVGYLSAERPVLPRWRPRHMRELLGFGLPVTAAGFAGVWYRNIDYLILGIRLPATAVGFYYRAFTVGVEYERRLSGIVGRIAFPVYARTEDSERRLVLRMRIVRVNVAVVYPILALFIALAPVFMPWLFGARWIPAVLPAQILAVAGMASCVRNLTSPSVLAAGRPRALFIFAVAETLLYGATVWIASAYGLTVVCIAVSSFQIASLVISYTVLLHRAVGLGRDQIFRDLGPAVLASAPLLAVAMALRSVIGSELPVPVLLIIAGGAGGATYLVALRALAPKAWGDVAMLVLRVVPGRARPSSSVSAHSQTLAPAQQSST